ncbi:MAG: energy transducer TonB [Terracidiphilus sp.]
MTALRTIAFVYLALCFCAAAFANQKAEERARPLLQAAAERSLFHADKSAPFDLLVKFTLLMPSSKPTTGAFSWLVTSEGDSRKETRFLDYTDLEVNRGATLWIRRSTDFQPMQAGWVEGAFTTFTYLNRAEDEITRYSTTSDHHVQLRCIDLLRDKMAMALCFDPDDNLRKVELKDSQITYEYSDYRPARKKFAPYRMSAKREGQVVFDGTIDVLSLGAKFDPSLLTPPTGAIKRGGCLNPTLPTLKSKVVPEYPSIARTERQQATVTAYVLIASDGKVQNPVIVQTGGQYFDASVLTAVRRWQFQPARCGDAPIDFEEEISVNFTIHVRRGIND